MAEYLATGRSPQGRKVTERIEADSADEAVQLLRDRGFDEVVLHTDDVGSLYSKQSEVAGTFSPREFLFLRDLPRPLSGFLLVTYKLYQNTAFLSLMLLGVLGWRRYTGQPWSFFLDTLPLILLFLPALWALVAQFVVGDAAAYEQFIEASAWGRWEEVLRRAETLRGVPPEEVAFRKATALAALGRPDEAFREVEPFGDGEAMPEWLYLGRLADVHSALHRHADAIATTERALELAPDNATVLLDLARLEIRHRRDARRARQHLARAREHALSDVLQPFATSIEGLIRLEEGAAREARQLLEGAFRGISRFRHASPLIGAALDQTHAYLALAWAAEGDLEKAREHFRLAKPRMAALDMAELIARCEAAIPD